MFRITGPLIVGLSFITTVAFGQVRIGVLGGVNFSTVQSNDQASTGIDGNTFSGLGIILDVELTNNLSFRTEPSYITKGATINVMELGLAGQNIVEYDYLDVPLLAAYRFASGDLQPYVLIGAVLSYRASTEHARLIRPGEEFLVDADPVLKKFDAGATIGGGLSYPLGRSALFLQGRYTLGFYDIGKIAEADVMNAEGVLISRELIDAEQIRNRGFLLSIGFTVSLGR